MNSKPLIDDSHGVAAHFTGRDRVENSGGNVAGLDGQVFIGMDMSAGQKLLGLESGNSFGLHDFSRQVDRFCCHITVGLGRKVIGSDGRVLVHVR